MRRTAILVSLLLLGARAARADDDDPLAGLSGAKALEYAKELSTDAMKGRRSGIDSGKAAEDWMVGKLGNLGVTPLDPDGTYTNALEFGTTLVAAPIALTIGEKAAEYGTEYVDLSYTGAGKVDAEVVFVGYGISAKDRGLDDYAGVDVKGKAVLALRGAPAGREGEFAEERKIGAKSSLAADRGAVAFLVCEGPALIGGASIQQRFVRPGLPALWVTQALADTIVKRAASEPPPRTIDSLRREIDAGGASKSFATGTKVHVEVNAKYWPRVAARNVLGGFRGKDPDLRNEAIVVGAHLDHLGVDVSGRVYNGADDNASGSAALLALLETLVGNGWAPKRTVVFVWFAGEEQGLVGSRSMATAPSFDADYRVAAMLNLDMAGQGKPALKLAGGEGYPDMWKRLVAFVPQDDRAGLRTFTADESSDHWPFYERGVPAFFAVTDGEHANYHQVGDDAANLKPECLEAAARVIGRMLVGLADLPTPLRTDHDAATFALHEGARVVEGTASSKAVAATLARGTEPADRAAFVEPGWSAVVVPVDERAPATGATWAKLVESVGRRSSETVLVRAAPDLVNAPRGMRTAILPRYVCYDSARRAPVDFTALRAQGVRWIDPFDPAKPPTDAERDAALAAAVAARMVVDLTGLPAAGLAAARSKLGAHPATYRIGAPLSADAKAAAAALSDRRKALGASTLVLLSGGAEDPVLASGLGGAPDPSIAPVAVVSEDTGHLESALTPVSPDLEDPHGAARVSVRSLFGGSFADLLRRVGP